MDLNQFQQLLLEKQQEIEQALRRTLPVKVGRIAVFGIVNNSNIAPASKERVERLINSLLDNCENEIESLLSLLPKETRWTSSDQGRFFASTMFPNIDVTTRQPKVSCGRWEQYLTVRETLLVMEDFFARKYL